MGELLIDLSFEDWVLHLFDHPAPGPRWHDDLDAPYWSGPPDVAIAYVTRLFEDPVPALEPFSDAQLNQGFWYLLSNGCSDIMFVLTDMGVPLDARVRCVRAFTTVFRDVFAVRCTPHLSHRDEPGAGALNAACYMWWDLLPLGSAPRSEAERSLARAPLDVMAAVLDLDSMACQESALHGLGHWGLDYPGEVATIVDRFVATHPTARPELLAYAKAARSGCVL